MLTFNYIESIYNIYFEGVDDISLVFYLFII